MTFKPPRKRHYPLWYLMLGLSSLPMPVLYLLADFLYVLLFHVTGYRKKVVLQNLRNSFPEKQEKELLQIARTFYRNFADIVVEILKTATISAGELHRRMRYTNPELPRFYLEQGRPLIVLGSHACNWEWILADCANTFQYPIDGVYKPLASPFFEAFMLRLRSRLGPRLVPMKDTLRTFVRRRNEVRGIALLSDQTPPRGEIQYWTRFLNQDTGFYVGADKLAATFGYPVIFVGIRREKRGHYAITFEPIYDGKEKLNPEEHTITEAYAQILERWIQQYPADYLWTHKRWKHKRPVQQNEAAATAS